MFQIEVIEEYKLYGFYVFIADVGGYLGLLLGASLLSLIEEIFNFFEEYYYNKRLVKPTSPAMSIQ